MFPPFRHLCIFVKRASIHAVGATGKADCIALYTSERMHVCMQAVIQDMRVAMSAMCMHVAFCICARLARQGFDAMYILLHDCLHASIAYVLVITSFIQGLYIYCRVYTYKGWEPSVCIWKHGCSERPITLICLGILVCVL